MPPAAEFVEEEKPKKQKFSSNMFMEKMVKQPLHYMNPVYIAGKVDPVARRIGRLFQPMIRQPKKQVNWLRTNITWKNLRGPLSAAAAVVLGGICAVVSQASTGVALSPASVMSITTIVMEMGATERFYVRSALRILGTLLGAALGMGLGAVGVVIGGSVPSQFQDNSAYIAAEAYRLSMVAIVALVTFFGMKFFEKISYAFMMFGVTFFSVLYTTTFVSALTAVLSAIAGVLCSIVTIVLFQFPKADAILADTHRGAVENLFTLVRFALEADPRCMDDFDDCSSVVRNALVNTAASFEIYSQWRKWTGRQVAHDFDQLSRATRPLYYVSYSMYWTLVEAPSANPNGGVYFFCDHPSQYHEYFYQPRALFEGAIMAVQSSLCLILIRDPNDTLTPEQHMDMIVHRHLWQGCMRNIHVLKEQYMEHGHGCFSTVGQHWSVIDYLNQSISLTMAVVAYVHAIAEIFLPTEIGERIYPTLQDICENLSQFRNEGAGRWITNTGDHDKPAAGIPIGESSPSRNAFIMASSHLPRGMANGFDDSDEVTDKVPYPGTLNRYTWAARSRRTEGFSPQLSPVEDELHQPLAFTCPNPHRHPPNISDEMFGENPQTEDPQRHSSISKP